MESKVLVFIIRWNKILSNKVTDYEWDELVNGLPFEDRKKRRPYPNDTKTIEEVYSGVVTLKGLPHSLKKEDLICLNAFIAFQKVTKEPNFVYPSVYITMGAKSERVVGLRGRKGWEVFYHITNKLRFERAEIFRHTSTYPTDRLVLFRPFSERAEANHRVTINEKGIAISSN